MKNGNELESNFQKIRKASGQKTYKGKYIRLFLAAAFLLGLSYSPAVSQNRNVGIGTNSPHASAKLDVESTERGFLMPRMTTAQRDLINGGAPAAGLMIYNTTTDMFEYYNGTSWDMIIGGSSLAWTYDGNAPGLAWDGATGAYLGTNNNQPLVIATTNATPQRMDFLTGNTLRIRILGNGNIGIGETNPSNFFDIVQPNTGTGAEGYAFSVVRDNDLAGTAPTEAVVRILQDNQLDQHAALTVKQDGVPTNGSGIELPAVYAEVGASTSEQAIALWGDATGGNGTIGVLATGNGNASTNAAMQINDGEFTMGRTTNAPGAGVLVEASSAGTDYSQEGPSGVVELSLGGGALATSAPTSGVLQDLGTVQINNDYAKTQSIINVSVVDITDDGAAPNPVTNSFFIVNVVGRGNGSFTIHVAMIPNETNGTNYSTNDNIRIGYILVNPSK